MCVTAALLQRLGAIAGPWYDMALLVVGALAIHAGGNLVNTYFDYQKGVDDEGADDATLVLKRLPPSHVLALGMGCFAAGAVVTAYFCAVLGPKCLSLAVPGFLLGYCYTAGPMPLKYVALGDATIFVAFGPLTALSAYLALAQRWSAVAWWPLLYSLPIGFHTEGILHANNVRDIGRDRKAGVATLASRVSFRTNLLAFVVLMLAPYAGICALAYIHGPQLLVTLVTSPIAVRLVQAFAARDLQVLPQRTAQHNLLFGLLLTLALVRW
eukprot:EG_transcript_23925